MKGSTTSATCEPKAGGSLQDSVFPGKSPLYPTHLFKAEVPCQLLWHSLGDADPFDDEPPVTACHVAHMREAQKVKRLRFAKSTLGAITRGKATKFEKSGLALV